MTIIEHHHGTDAYDQGWYIIYLDPDGTCFDCIGPYDTETEAKRIMEGMEGG